MLTYKMLILFGQCHRDQDTFNDNERQDQTLREVVHDER